MEIKLSEKFTTKVNLTILFLVTFALYGQALTFGFVTDDYWFCRKYGIQEVGQSFYSAQLSVIKNYYRPTRIVTFWLDNLLYGYNAAGYHLTNIIIHFLTAVVIYFFVIELYKNKTTAFFTALIFSTIYYNATDVVWISGRTDLLCALFLFLSFLFFLKFIAHNHQKIYFFGSLIAFILSLLSKETAICLPFIYIGYLFLYQKDSLKKYRILIFSYLAVIPVYIIFRLIIIPRTPMGTQVMYTHLLLGNLRVLSFKTLIIFSNNNLLLSAMSCLLLYLIFYDFQKKMSQLAPKITYIIFNAVLFSLFAAILLSAYYGNDSLKFARVLVVLIMFFPVIFVRHIKKINNPEDKKYFLSIVFAFCFILLSIFPSTPAAGSFRYLYIPSFGFSLLCAHTLRKNTQFYNAKILFLLACFVINLQVNYQHQKSHSPSSDKHWEQKNRRIFNRYKNDLLKLDPETYTQRKNDVFKTDNPPNK